MDRFYFPVIDFIITLIITVVLVYVGGLTILNDVFWVFLIYIIALGITNLNKLSIDKIDRKKEKGRKNYIKKMKNRRSPKNTASFPKELKEIGTTFDYDVCFLVFKFALGMIVVMILAVISSMGHLQQKEFGKFTFTFYIDAFVFPLVIIWTNAFMYKQSVIQAIKEVINCIFFKDEKFTMFRGVFGLIGVVSIFYLAIKYTLLEFVNGNSGIATRVIILGIGIMFMIYSFVSAAWQWIKIRMRNDIE